MAQELKAVIDGLSHYARTTLLGARGSRQGAQVPGRSGHPEPFTELREAGLISPGGNLTALGASVRQILADRMLAALFGDI